MLITSDCIVRIEASSNYSKFFFLDVKVPVTAKVLKWFEEKLPRQLFTLMHRSHLINKKYLHLHQQFGKTVALQNRNIIPVSGRRKKMVWQKLVAACVIFFLCKPAIAQSVGIGTTTPHASAQLDINSTTKGTLITTMTSSQRSAIVNPATGLLVYDVNKKTVYMYDGNRWLPFLFSNTDKNPATLLNPPVVANDFFGYKVAIDGDYAIIGAYGKSSGQVLDAGAAYIYFRNNGVWEQQALLTASDGETDDFFGASVGISGDYAVVGAWGDDIGADTDQGSVYVFNRTGTVWAQQTKLTAVDGAANDFFGHSVDISGSTIIVGADGDNIGVNINQGSAYVFTRNLSIWTFQAKLIASDGDFGDGFGNSVSISGPYALAGAYLDDIGVNVDQGSVYSFFEFTNAGGWTTGQPYHDKIEAPDGAAGDFFGVSVSISGLAAIIGASGDDIGVNNSQGSAYTFFKPGINPGPWLFPVKITAPDGAENDNFGISVSRTATHSIVGAYRQDGVGGILNQGSAYIFNTQNSFYSFRRKIDDDAGDIDGFFGFAVAISGVEVVIGAYGKNSSSGQVGFLNFQ
jgi:hypothetical protein